MAPAASVGATIESTPSVWRRIWSFISTCGMAVAAIAMIAALVAFDKAKVFVSAVRQRAQCLTATSQRRVALLVLAVLSITSTLATFTTEWAAQLTKFSDGLTCVTLVFLTYEVISRFVYHFWDRNKALCLVQGDLAFRLDSTVNQSTDLTRVKMVLAWEIALLVVVALCFCLA